ncbi:MAG: glycerol-3-phosphate cytidyltransferase TagD [uncultured bacterium]|uniref:Glycerol-3-phosphate cytidyltransferase TagD n=3 Tax=Candidatus Daviesiibacteriota TaxID=1752718 RepID=A0A0G0H8B1_9BACT|nr:MAG: glycerol-3-phosphate cytidyltransferase TagD [uncultured bacterium]KKQ08329.1 MAG: Glycerol-3-phosphate cytidyltransferase TagD [Candidatus Daviesbacteria bacterium GW2011_GWB1_36_5]KKQ15185.1 MAG: Glycerol-3-phosphate cytidyltransferase TagD [Candidatus Daviesbacteria bacterium GW2011_GWA1_36_8]OGE31316.1 MAG: hypothetical protein A3C99_00775 [Candidatus Daviesbacteria bacterium RIFCSPHIGHO2_02_FULL_37_9]OGE36232.1 MAG: hypothetical protein A3E66_05510 [Candidatus Daviesbacteria bacter
MSKKIVLVGGAFDILHKGHLIFLEKAKQQGDELVLLLESDEKIKKLKGEGRPVNTQSKRAAALKKLAIIDKIISLHKNMANSDYDKLILKIKPSVIATTKGDKNISHKLRQAQLTGAKLIEVTDLINGHSTTEILKKSGI